MGEGLEEAVSAAVDPLLQRVTYNKEAENATVDEVLHDVYIGALTGGVFQGIGLAANLAAGQKNTASGVEAGESTAVDTNPAKHTPQEQAVIEEYQAQTDDELKMLFEEHQANPKRGFSRRDISPVSERQAEDASRLLGGSYAGYTNAINSNGVKHILKRHGPNGAADNSLADLNDAARMGYVLDKYDNVEIATTESGDVGLSREFMTKENEPAPMLRFSKKVNGTYYVVEAVPESKYKKFWVVSAYMQTADGGTQALDARGFGKSLASSLSAADSTVPQPEAEVNGITPEQARFREWVFAEGRRQAAKRAAAAQGGGQENVLDAGKVTAALEQTAPENAPEGGLGRRTEFFKSPVAKRTDAGYTGINTEVESNGREEVHLRNSSQRTGGSYSGGQVSAMEEGAGRAESRNGAGRPADSGAASFTYGAKISTKALLGDDGASANHDLRVVTGGDSAHTQEARQMAKERGLELVLFAGGNLKLTDKNGNPYEARAYIEGDRVYVRADHSLYTADQLMRHEVGHDMIAKGEVDVNVVRDRIGNERAEQLSRTYAEAYAGSDLTAEEIWEEVICDSLADMNIFSNHSKSAEIADSLGKSKRAAQEEAGKVDAERGPPATDTNVGGKASRDLEERRRALRKGEMVNKFHKSVNWPAYYEKLKADQYNPEYYDDGEIAYMYLDGYTLKLEMQTNGEFSVVDRKKGVYHGQSAKNRRPALGSDGGTKVSGQRDADRSGSDRLGKRPSEDGNEYRADDRGGKDSEGSSESGTAVHGVTGKTSRETLIPTDFTEDQRAALSATQEAVRTTVREELDRMGKEYGWIKRGENPVRDVSVPKRTSDDKKVSRTIRTVMEAAATPEEVLPGIEALVAEGEFSYEVYGDKAAISEANEYISNRGWGEAAREWFKAMEKGEVSKRNTAVGWTLYNNAVNSGDVETAIDVLDAMVEHQRNAAQALQATRILKKLSPETQLYAVQKSIRRLQQELNDRYGSKKEGAPQITIDPELAKQLLTAKDQKGRDEAMKMIYRDVGRQMPSRFLDKWAAWRYLAMLGNARTHVRNIVGNAAFAPVVTVKNLTATAIESAINRVSGGRTGRSKSLVTLGRGDRALLSAAWGDYANVEDAAMGGGKYSDSVNTNRYIEEGRRVFGRTEQAKTKVGKAVSGTLGRAVEAGRKGNSKLLDAEDRWFSKPHYAAAMASYCKANGVTAEQIRKGEGVDEARAYAMKEAQKATYRDTNAFSTAISQLGRYEGKNPVKKGISTVMEGILPFRKTPANILARGLEYSPAGIIKSLTYDLHKVKQGDMTAAELIDDLSAGLTGTGLMALGVLLAAQGLIRGHGGDDEDKREFEELMGHQSYSLEVGGKSVTLDWLAPECLPFFVGVNLWETTQGENERVTLSAILSAVGTVTEPLMEMSCLQSLNEIFDAVGYAQSEGLSGLPSALVSAATSYLTQGVPTLLGQLERSGQGERMTTYTEKNAFLTSDMQYTLGSVSGKLPGVDYNQIAYIDAWGRTETTGSVVERAFNNMLNPAYTSNIEMSEMEEELLRLYEATGEAGVFPDRAKKYFTVNKERLDLNSAQYVSYAKRKGKTAYDMLTELTGSKEYEEMSDADKVEAVGWVYDYADAVAKAAISDYQMTGWEKKAEDAREKKGVSVLDYIRFKWYVTVVSTDGNSNTSQKEAEAALNRVRGLTREQKAYLWQTTNSGWLEKSNPFT